MTQITWTATRHGVSYSAGRFYKRFAVTSRTDGFTIVDSATGAVERTYTLTGAQAWATARVEMQAVVLAQFVDRVRA